MVRLILALAVSLPLVAQDQWRQVWSDEFEGSTIDRNKWSFDIGAGKWGNNEWEYYTDRSENASVSGGMLRITARREDYSGRKYTSARMITKGKFSRTYGRFEGRLKIPRGQGIWPAFWMLGDDIDTADWPACGEIDIMENIGKPGAEQSTVYGTVHMPTASGSVHSIGGKYSLPNNAVLADDFHVYAVEWEAGEIRLYLDAVHYKTIKPADAPAGARWVFDHPFHLLLNIAVGGDWPGYPDESTVFPQEMLVDYVRVYERAAPKLAPERAVVNGAGFREGFAPGSWVTVAGTDLSATTRTWNAGDFAAGIAPSRLDGVGVTFNGEDGYVSYVSPTQVNVQAPDTGPGPVSVRVIREEPPLTSAAVIAEARLIDPAFFLWLGKYAVATHGGTEVAAARTGLFEGRTSTPAKPGEVITFWGTGFGASDPPALPGRVVTGAPELTAPVRVLVDGQPADPVSAVMSPGYLGLYQIAVRLPGGLRDGDLPVVAEIAGRQTPDGVFLTVLH